MIIGVVGLIGAGKGSFGDYLTEKYSFKTESFAKPLKDAVAAIFGWPRCLLEGNTTRSRTWREIPDEWWEKALDWPNHKLSAYFPRFTPRVCLQLFGTEVLRESFHDQLWILSLQNRIRAMQGNVIVTDCRFPNELTAIKEAGGYVVRLRRGEDPDWFDLAELANAKLIQPGSSYFDKLDKLSSIHVSERAWIGFPFDRVIDNNGTLDDYHRNIDQFMAETAC